MAFCLGENEVDAIVTDPPYELAFMGKKWDGTGVAFDVETWRQCLRVLKPGGHLLAFGGTRTYHRMVCAIEDAGFEIRDQIGWAYGSGFPKSHNGEWGGTALKPAWEPICMARKPLIGTVAANVLAHGTGALNIDGCRVPGSKPDTTRGASSKASSMAGPLGAQGRILDDGLGRWPANLIHDGSDEVIALFPDSNGSGTERKLKRGPRRSDEGWGMGNAPGELRDAGSGSAARFFYCAKASRSDRNDGCESMPKKALNWSSGTQSPGTFQAEGTDRSAHNAHPTVKPTDLMRYLCRLVTPPGGTVLDPFMGSGSTGRGAVLEGFKFIGCELSPEYLAIAQARIAAAAARGPST